MLVGRLVGARRSGQRGAQEHHGASFAPVIGRAASRHTGDRKEAVEEEKKDNPPPTCVNSFCCVASCGASLIMNDGRKGGRRRIICPSGRKRLMVSSLSVGVIDVVALSVSNLMCLLCSFVSSVSSHLSPPHFSLFITSSSLSFLSRPIPSSWFSPRALLSIHQPSPFLICLSQTSLSYSPLPSSLLVLLLLAPSPLLHPPSPHSWHTFFWFAFSFFPLPSHPHFIFLYFLQNIILQLPFFSLTFFSPFSFSCSFLFTSLLSPKQQKLML